MTPADLDRAGLDALGQMIDSSGLGPVTSIGFIGDTSVVRVELDGASERKSRTLARWLTLITAHDMTLGKYTRTDDLAFLNIRGQFPRGTRVVLVTPYAEHREAAQLAAIRDQIERQDVPGLVGCLASIEGGDR